MDPTKFTENIAEAVGHLNAMIEAQSKELESIGQMDKQLREELDALERESAVADQELLEIEYRENSLRLLIERNKCKIRENLNKRVLFERQFLSTTDAAQQVERLDRANAEFEAIVSVHYDKMDTYYRKMVSAEEEKTKHIEMALEEAQHVCQGNSSEAQTLQAIQQEIERLNKESADLKHRIDRLNTEANNIAFDLEAMAE